MPERITHKMALLSTVLLLLSLSSAGLAYDFRAVPSDAVVFRTADFNTGHAVLNCAFSPPFDGVSWQFSEVAAESEVDGASSKYYAKWSDVFIDGFSHTKYQNDSLRIAAWADNSVIERKYRCIGNIRNWGSVISPAGKVTLAVPPFATSNSEMQQSKEYEGGLLKLFCPIRGVPHPTITWFKNDLRLELNPRVSLLPLTQFTLSALEISNLQVQDQGLYSCEGTNVVGDQKVYISQLDVIKGHTSEGLSFYESPANFSALVGEDVLLQCAARGFPTSIKYTWYRDNIQLQENAYDAVGSGNIRLKGVTLKDTGSYKCIAAVSGMVEAKSQDSIYLNINEAPRFSVPMGSFSEPQGEEEGSIVLSCPVTAHPAPRVSWFVDKKPLKVDGIYFIQEPDSLQIFGLLRSDSSIYECIAENDFGSIYRVFHLTVSPRTPVTEFKSIGRPQNFNAESSSINSVTLTWRASSSRDYEIVRYLISYYEQAAEYPRVKKVTTLNDKLSLQIGNLQEDTSYVFKIQGVNSVDQLGEEATTSAYTLKRTLIGDIVVTVEKTESTSALIKWNVISFSYKEFQLEYVNSCFSVKPLAARASTTYQTYLLQNLEENCRYNVTVSSGNNQGQVGIGTASFRTLGAKPSASPKDVRAIGIDPNQIEVWWAPVDERDQNAEITSYLVRFRPEKLKAHVNTKSMDGGKDLHMILDELEKNSDYQVAVAAGNAFGYGPYSDWISTSTLKNKLVEDRVPGKVKDLTVVDVTESTITIKWEGTEDGLNVRVRSYVLYIDQIVPITVYDIVSATENRYTFTDLSVHKNYIIKVAAKNEIGTGPDSLVYQRTAEAPADHDMPLQMPNNVSVKAISHDTLQVYFTSNNPTKDDSWFKVRVKWRYPTIFTQEYNCRPPLTSCFVSGLRPGTEYEIDVQAFRGAPDDPNAMSSPWSMTALGRTLETVPGSAPTDLTASPVQGQPNNVLLMWMGPKEPNGAITGYDISYTTDLSAKDWHVNSLDQVFGNVLAHEVKDLTLQTTYYFKIAARNSKGLGPFSSVPVAYTTPVVAKNVGDSANSMGQGDSDDGLDKEYVYIVIAGVVGITVIVVCLIIAFVVCRIINHQAAASIIDKQSITGRPDSNMTHQGSLYSKQTQLQQPDLTDLYVHKDNLMELKAGKEPSLTYMPTGSHRSNDSFMRSGSPPDIQKHLMTTNFARDSPQGYMMGGQPGLMPQGMHMHHGSPSPSAMQQMQIAHDMQQHQQPHPNLIRPTPVRLPPPLQQHPMSMHSEVPMMAIKPMFMQSNNLNHSSPPPMANSPTSYNRTSSTGPYKHYESDTMMGDYNGSDGAVYSPPSSVSGGNVSRDSSLNRGGNNQHSIDKALRALPAMPPELKPLSSLHHNQGLPPSMLSSGDPHMVKMAGKPQYAHPNMPMVPNAQVMMGNIPTSNYRGKLPPVSSHGMDNHVMSPSESYMHSAMEQEADACVDRIAGLMKRLNTQSTSPNSNYHMSPCEMDC